MHTEAEKKGAALVRDMAADAASAAARIADLVEHTPLHRAASLSEAVGAPTWCKLENRQATGSFKLRGATNRLLTLSDEQRARGCVAASSGNHGAALACAARRLGVGVTIFVPEQTSAVKVDKIRVHGGDVRFFGHDGLDTELHARAFAGDNGLFYVSPYNDTEVIAGQGSIGVELLEDLPDVEAVFIAVGGGGLISGVGSVLKAHNPSIRVYGCQPAASPVMARSIEAGHLVDVPSEPTVSDGTAGGIEQNSITFPLNQAVVDDWVLVSEEQIVTAMRDYIALEGDVIEGAAGVAVAGLLQCSGAIAGAITAVIICGGNVSDEVLRHVRA